MANPIKHSECQAVGLVRVKHFISHEFLYQLLTLFQCCYLKPRLPKKQTMKAFQCALILAACLFTVHAADEFDNGLSLAENEARTFFVNFTSSLIQVRKNVHPKHKTLSEPKTPPGLGECHPFSRSSCYCRHYWCCSCRHLLSLA